MLIKEQQYLMKELIKKTILEMYLYRINFIHFLKNKNWFREEKEEKKEEKN